MRHVFILNPKAGKFDQTPGLCKIIPELFKGREQDFKIEITQYAGHAKELALKFAKDKTETMLYACGGDGTLSEVAQALPENPQLILAPVPIGTGNDFVRSYMRNIEISDLLPRLLNGHVVPIDLLMAGNQVCLNIASVGLDASIALNMARFKHLPLIKGETAYTLSIIYCFFTPMRYRYQFEVDSQPQPKGDVIFAVAANGRYYGGGFMAAPTADMQDGMMDFIQIPARSRLSLLPMIKSYKRGEHLLKYDFIKHVQCKQVRILSDKPVALNRDGEIAPEINPVIEVLPAAARLLVLADDPLGRNMRAQISDDLRQACKTGL